jgi:tRNA nucleotidyltransferase/poly(A) polymerase
MTTTPKLILSSATIQSVLRHPLVQRVLTLAEHFGGTAYLVGGAVRDLYLTGELPLDLDFMLIDCQADQLAKLLADGEQGHLVPLDWDFGIHRVVFDNGINIDLANALEHDLQIDLGRRDLTVNAMALDLKTGDLIDPFHGKADLETGKVRMVSEFNLLDDPLRMLRVFRIAAMIQANEIDEDTLAVIRQNGARIWESAAERIQYEFLRLLSVERCFPALKSMADCGLLEVLIPELTPMRSIGCSITRWNWFANRSG